MLRKNSIIKFALLAIIAILGVLLCVCPFSVPYSTSNYNGFVGAVNKGVQLQGGVSAVYECKLADGESGDLVEAIDDSIDKIKAMFKESRFQELSVSRRGADKVEVVVSGVTENHYSFEYFNEGKSLSFTLNQYSEGATPTVYMTSKSISRVRPHYDYQSSAFGITLEFSGDGKEALEELREQAENSGNETVYIYMGEILTENLFAEINYEDLKSASTFITSSKITDAETATKSAYSISAGSLNVELNLKEVSSISPIFGKNTMLYIAICYIVIILGAMVFLYARYGHLGLLANLSLVFYLVIYSFLMMAIPFIVFNLATVIASVFAFAIAVFANVAVFEKVKEEYSIGKKIHLACKGGFKKALWTIIDSHVLLVLAGALVWIFAPLAFKAFGICVIAGAIVSAFASLALTRYFVKIYLPLNSTKPKKLRLYRDKSVREIKDEVEIIPEDAVTTEALGGSDE